MRDKNTQSNKLEPNMYKIIKETGFTIVELVIVIAIVAIFAAMIVPVCRILPI